MVDAQILNIINSHYQDVVPPEHPDFIRTSEYLRLQTAKKSGLKIQILINQLAKILENTCPEYDYRQIPYLADEGTDVCYVFEVLLNKNCYFYEFNSEGDKKTLNETDGAIKTLTIYISILGLFYTSSISNLWLDEDGEWVWNYDNELDSSHVYLWDIIQDFFAQRGYKLLDKQTLGAKVPWVYLETKDKGDANIFHCLFSELYDLH